MKAKELMRAVYDIWKTDEKKFSNDKLVIGDEEKEVKKVAVCCIATFNVINEAIKENADLIITHEPTTHCDMPRDNEMVVKKLNLLKTSGITVYKLHDHTHFSNSDKIIEGVLKKLGWEGVFDGNKKFEFKEEVKTIDIIKDIKEKLNLNNIRLVGSERQTVKSVSMCVGSWGDDYVRNELVNNDIDLVICGEVCEWKTCEFARDYYQSGFGKGLLILGHMGSEKEGMNYICNILKDKFKKIDFTYIDSGEVYKRI